MKSVKSGYYHCSHCGGVFASQVKPKGQLVCSHCQHSPYPKEEADQSAQDWRASGKYASTETRAHAAMNTMERGKDVADFVGLQKRRNKKQMKLAMAVWVVLLLAVVGGVSYMRQSDQEDAPTTGEYHQRLEDEQKLKMALPQCIDTLESFLHSENVKFLYHELDQLGKLEAYQSRGVLPSMRGSIKVRRADYISRGATERIEASVVDQSGKVLELIFLKEEDAWKIDFEHLMKHSELPWLDFLNSKQGEGDFRVYVRRLLSSRIARDQAVVTFYGPSQYADGSRGAISPSVIISENSEVGSSLLKALEKVEKRDVKLTSDLSIGSRDPSGMARVMVRLAFETNDKGEPELRVKEFHQGHWRGRY